MKLCINCRHFEKYVKENGSPELSRCNHPSLETRSVSLLDGKEYVTYTTNSGGTKTDYKPFADSLRRYGLCGEEAVLFEPAQEAVSA